MSRRARNRVFSIQTEAFDVTVNARSLKGAAAYVEQQMGMTVKRGAGNQPLGMEVDADRAAAAVNAKGTKA